MTGVQTCALPICFPVTIWSVQQKKWVLITPKKEPLGDSLGDWLIDSVIYHEDEMSITYVLFFKDRIRASSKFRSMCYEWTFIPHTKCFE